MSDRLFNWLAVCLLRAILTIYILMVLETIRFSQCIDKVFPWPALC